MKSIGEVLGHSILTGNNANTTTSTTINNQSNFNGTNCNNNSYNDGAIYANSSVIASNNVSTGNFPGNRKTIQLYATLPKKACKKKLTLAGNLSTINNNDKQLIVSSTNVPPLLPEKPLNLTANSVHYQQLIKRSEHQPPNAYKSDAECSSSLTSVSSIMRITRPRIKTNPKTLSVYSVKDSDLSDNYYSEWEAVKCTKEPLKRSLSGSTSTTTTTTTQSSSIKSPTSLFSSSASIKSVDADIYSETSIGDLTSESLSNKKHKIRRKLLIGSLKIIIQA